MCSPMVCETRKVLKLLPLLIEVDLSFPNVVINENLSFSSKTR